MKNNKTSGSFIHIGSSSLLVIFLVLSLVSFAVLALSSAQRDFEFSKRLSEHNAQYYEASAQAEALLSQIDGILSEISRTAPDLASYRLAAAEELSQLQTNEIPVSLEQSGTIQTLSFLVPFSQNQALSVRLEITDYTNAETYYMIRAWQIISTDSWENDQPVQLLQMGE